jgi:hypothetical protein
VSKGTAEASVGVARGFATTYAAVDHRLEQRIWSMKPEHETRRKIIREWMSLPKDKRQTEEQAKPFAKKAMERLPSSGDPYGQIMRWLLPRVGKP